MSEPIELNPALASFTDEEIVREYRARLARRIGAERKMVVLPPMTVPAGLKVMWAEIEVGVIGSVGSTQSISSTEYRIVTSPG